MRFEFFAVPVVGGEAIAKELNSFMASHRVVQVERVLVPDGPRSLWAVCVMGTPGGDSARSGNFG